MLVLEAVQAINSTNHKKKQRIIGNRHRNRGYGLQEVDAISDAEFTMMFRMDRAGFSRLYDLIDPFLYDCNEEMARRSSGSIISKTTKLYCTLRWLAGGSSLDICFAWGVSKAAFYMSDSKKGFIWPVIEAIDQAFIIGLPLDNVEQLKVMANEFSTYSHGELKGCVTAIDGWVAKTRKPFHNEVTDVVAYRNRHGCWGLVVLAGCDARCRFTMFSCINTGSTNDVTAWNMCDLKTLLMNGRLPEPYFLIGDEAFSCTNYLLTPYSGRGLGVWKDSFNYHLSVMRQCIERSFAILTQRWGILWRPLRCEYSRWTLLLTVLSKLHNFCIDSNIPLQQHRFYEDVQEGDESEILLNGELSNEALLHGGHANRRTLFTRELQDKGIRRPNHAAINSHA
jgi:hypothetical protein